MPLTVPPLLVICYKRLDQIEGILSAYKDFGGKVIHFAIDGPKTPLDREEQELLLDKIRQTCIQLELHPIVRHLDKNAGLAQNVISGLDWFFSSNSSGVIIEDDLVFESDLFEWFSFALKEFESNSDVMMISGNQFMSNSIENVITASNYPLIWGWATTSLKWKEMRSWLDEELSPPFKFSPKVKNYWKTGFLRVKMGEVNSWAIPLAYNFRFRSKLCVIPPKNLAINAGVDKFATHTINEESLFGLKLERFSTSTVFSPIEINREQIRIQNEYLEKNIYRISNLHSLGHFRRIRLMKAFLKSRINNNV